MKAPIRHLALMFGTIFLLASSQRANAGAFDPPSGDTVTISVSSATVTTNSAVSLTVQVTRPNGVVEADGTTLTASLSPATIGKLSGATGSSGGSTASNTLSGGLTTFAFLAGNSAGTATITISVPPVNGHPTSVTASTTITVTQGTGNNSSLLLTATTSILPVNPYSLGEQDDGSLGFPTNYIGSPYIAEVDVLWKGMITGAPVNGTISAAVLPVSLAALSTLDDPSTPWTGETATPPTDVGNEFLTLIGSGPVTVTAGVGVIFVHAGSVTGTVILQVTAQDPDTGQTITSQIPITIVPPAGSNLPASVQLSQQAGGLYIQGTNGPHDTVITANVTSLIGAPANAPAGQNNINFTITGPAGTDAMLFGVDGSGALEAGKTIQSATENGVVSIDFVAGKVQGPVQIQATAFGSYDGIVNSATANTTVIVSDGQLYSLTLTSPYQGAIAVNGVTGTTSTSTGTSGIPSDLNGTYSLTVSAIATDREGNPVLPGTPVNFGLVDSPQSNDGTSPCGIGTFQICGIDGDPQPGGFYFNAPSGQFSFAGGGVGPGDTLIVFGKQSHGAPPGNDQLESSLKVTLALSNTLLETAYPFNYNDTNGVIADPGPVLPYVIGRASIGNINSPAYTDTSVSGTAATSITGVATTTLNYPVSQLNKSVVIWAQGTGVDQVHSNAPSLITDAMPTVYPGVAPISIVVSPTSIPGNTTTNALVCVYDAADTPIPGLVLDFAFTNLGVGSGSIAGISGSGSVGAANATGTAGPGCANILVTTNGVAGGSTSGAGTPTLTFSGAGATASATIDASGDLLLLAVPSALGGAGGTVTLSLLSGSGAGIPNVQLTGTCTGNTVSISSLPRPTSASGSTSVAITASLNGYGSAGTGTCTFTTATGSPTATVNLSGINYCVLDPTNALCDTTTTTPTPSVLDANIDFSASGSTSPTGTYTLTSSPSGVICSGTLGTDSYTNGACSAPFTTGTTVTLTVTGPTGFVVSGWTGNCAPIAGTNSTQAKVIVNSATDTCTVSIQ